MRSWSSTSGFMSAAVLNIRKDIIEKEKQLPPSQMITRVIPLEPMQRLTYNVLAALIAGNVYTSRSKDTFRSSTVED